MNPFTLFRGSLLLLGLVLGVDRMAAAEPPAAAAPPDRATVLAAMKRATTVMVEKVGYKGGYVWSYLPDLSRRWGEMEATPTMMWLQSPGTLSVGHVLLDAYHATGDEFYYNAARQTAQALMTGQHPAGGWNYAVDLAGEESLKRWYDTVGRNGWRLEEFQHYYGNATFDDSTSSEAASFMLRFYLEKRDPQAKASLDKAIQFVLTSQYPNGGWPQRFPLMGGFVKPGGYDYTGFVTFNDNVVAANIDFLVQTYAVLGDTRLLDPIRRGMDIFIATRQAPPQAGWALQHSMPDLKPAGARTYEPRALATHTTGNNIDQLIRFYGLTGDRKYLAPIPEALAWLDAVKLPPAQATRGSHPTFVELETNKPLFLHRTGSNVVNGRYFADYNPERTVGHYSSFRSVDVAGLRRRYEQAVANPPEQAMKDSPLRAGASRIVLPKYMANRGPALGGEGAMTRAARVVATLTPEGYWLSPLRSVSNPYKGQPPQEPATGDFSTTQVGDAFDTSPYTTREPVNGISVATFVANLGALIRAVDAER